jgi:hypothetical protein
MEHGRFIDKPAQVERDESAPDWAKGYKVEDLKRITTVFKRHDEGLMHGPFDRYRDRDAAADLRNGWLKLGPRDADGIPVWACVARELDRKQPVRDFTGGRMTLSPGTLYCTRMAFANEDAEVSVRAQLWTYDGPIAVECWQEHPGERALVSRLRAVDAAGQPDRERNTILARSACCGRSEGRFGPTYIPPRKARTNRARALSLAPRSRAA